VRARSVFDIILICIIWGSGFSAMKAGIEHVPSFLFVALRFMLTAGALTLIMRLRGTRFGVPREHWGRLAAVTVLFFGQQGLIFWGLNYTLASRTAVILNIQPIMTAILAHFFVAGDRMTVTKTLGLLLAFLGVQALFRGSADPAAASTLVGDLMILAASAAWAVQNVLTKKLARRLPPITIVFWECLAASCAFFVVSGCVERGRPVDLTNGVFLLCMAYIVLAATVYSFVRWVDLLRDNDPSTVSSFCFVTPVAGVFFGRALLSEPVTLDVVIATAAVAAGIVLANLRWRGARRVNA